MVSMMNNETLEGKNLKLHLLKYHHMNAIKSSGIILSIIALIVLSIPSINAQSDSTYTSIDGTTSIQVSTVSLVIAENNSMPWGYVEGKINNPASNYPVIIQFFQDNIPVHFAQVMVNEDDSYQYKFRVLNSEKQVFSGTYEIKIFKVVHRVLDNLV